MKKVGFITLGLLMLAAGVLLVCLVTSKVGPKSKDKIRGTLVKEYGQWKMYYI